MKIIDKLSEIEELNIENTAIALGKFDGLHKGHLEVMRRLTEEKTNGLKALVFTFSNNPKNFLKPENEKKSGNKLFTVKEKLMVYERMGIDIIVVYPLETGILGMEPETFIKNILVDKLGVKKVVCGENFRYGKDRKGDTNSLKLLGKKYGFRADVLPMISDQGEVISSTLIRGLISDGEIEKANRLLGYQYTIVGKVVHGNEIGRTIDTPTANIIPDEDKLLPPFGVYLSLCDIDGKIYGGITNIGTKPTVTEDKKKITVETYFLNYAGDLYDRILEIKLVKHTRNEIKFSGLTQLKEQLEKDKDMCRKYLKGEKYTL